MTRVAGARRRPAAAARNARLLRRGMLARSLVMSCALSLASTSRVAAHRLDEYLQAARIALGPDAVGVELDLTAGVAVAANVFASIDSDGDGALSPAEREAYATRMISSVVLEIDGRREAFAVQSAEFPSWPEMNTGTGSIRLKAVANRPAELPGAHRLYFRNTHRADASVYLVNALVPADGTQITAQRRDTNQHELWLDYRVPSQGGIQWSRVSRIAIGLGLVALVACVRRRGSWFATTAASKSK